MRNLRRLSAVMRFLYIKNKYSSMRLRDFLYPLMHVHDGSLPLYLHEDILKYEENRELEVHGN
jgi:hypothetical protein